MVPIGIHTSHSVSFRPEQSRQGRGPYLTFLRPSKESLQDITEKIDAELSTLLLKQYKHSMNSSTILSKADVHGKITYANDAFYNISQYNEEECFGRSHNIVRHPDMTEEIFVDMWQTITSKKEWRGIIKNRAKDGSDYIVDSIIIPLLDTNNEIIEYLGIRHDITKLEHYKEDL